ALHIVKILIVITTSTDSLRQSNEQSSK
ncbi:unnamed protein product, partial [Rotaria sordida]